MPSCRESSERYTSRPSPPYAARHFASGSSKKGNDGKTYIVSRPNVNGVKRWVKKSSAKKTKKRSSSSSRSGTPLRRMYPRPVHRSGGLESARGSERRRIANAQRAFRPSGSVVTELPTLRRTSRMESRPRITVSEYSPGEQERLNGYGLSNTFVTFKPYYSRPNGRWMFFDKEDNEFRHHAEYEAFDGVPAHGNTCREFWDDAQNRIDEEGYKVWVVDEIPDFWQEH